MKNVIEFKDVGLNFGGVKALDGISFEVKEGSLFSIIGPNGAGKTTLINSLCGLTYHSSGTIKVAGMNLENNRKKIKTLLLRGFFFVFLKK